MHWPLPSSFRVWPTLLPTFPHFRTVTPFRLEVTVNKAQELKYFREPWDFKPQVFVNYLHLSLITAFTCSLPFFYFPTAKHCIFSVSEYWMIYKGLGFLAVVWFGSSSTPFLFIVRKLSLFLSLPVCRRSSLPTSDRGGDMSHTTARKQGILYKSFHTVCLALFQKQRREIKDNTHWKTVESHLDPKKRQFSTESELGKSSNQDQNCADS
jgi:hypothetical protein